MAEIMKEKGCMAEGGETPEGAACQDEARTSLQGRLRETKGMDAAADPSEPLGRAIRLFALTLGLMILGGSFVVLSHSFLPSLALHTKAQLGAALMAVIASPLLFMMVRLVGLHISRMKNLEEELHDMTLTDDLTGLCTKREFTFFFEQTLKRAHRLNKHPFLLYAVVHDLKAINETRGRREGNAALVEAARILNETYRQSDIISRVGGNKFAILVLVTEPLQENLKAMADRLQQHVHLFNEQATRPYQLSMGMGMVPIDAGSPPPVDELLAMAEISTGGKERRDAENFGAACLSAAG